MQIKAIWNKNWRVGEALLVELSIFILYKVCNELGFFVGPHSESSPTQNFKSPYTNILVMISGDPFQQYLFYDIKISFNIINF